MTKEETVSYLNAYLDGDTSIGNVIPLRQVLQSAVEHLSVQLPEGLDKAAEEYACVNYDCETESDAFYHHIQIVAFKAGAEWQYQQDRAEFAKLKAKEWQDGYDEGAKWMAEQGVTKEAVIGMATEEIAINVSKKTLDSLGLGAGDKVIVQIRKK